MRIAALFKGSCEIKEALGAEAVHCLDLLPVLADMIDGNEIRHDAAVNEFGKRLDAESVDVHALAGDKTLEFPDLLGAAVRIAAVQSLGAGGGAHADLRGSAADRAGIKHAGRFAIPANVFREIEA